MNYSYDYTIIDPDISIIDADISFSTLAGMHVGTSYSGDTVSVHFSSELLEAEEITLNALIDSYDENGSNKKATDIKLYRYIDHDPVDRSIPPLNTNFDTGVSVNLFQQKSVVVFGEIRRVDYYATAVPGANGSVDYSDLVLSEEFTYTRNSIGFALSRSQVITWYKEDDTPHGLTKTRNKVYDINDSLQEGQKRRGYLVDRLMMNVSGILVATQTQITNPNDRIALGRAFIAAHKTGLDMFTQASSPNILYEVRDDVNPDRAWLETVIDANGTTIRQYILSSMNIWGLPL